MCLKNAKVESVTLRCTFIGCAYGQGWEKGPGKEMNYARGLPK